LPLLEQGALSKVFQSGVERRHRRGWNGRRERESRRDPVMRRNVPRAGGGRRAARLCAGNGPTASVASQPPWLSYSASRAPSDGESSQGKVELVAMHEQDKIEEAAFFLDHMAKREQEPKPYKYNVSAFLSAARSILQYARDEALTKAGGQQWYDGRTAGSPLLRFFRDKRDVNVHQEPVEPTRTFTVRHETRLLHDVLHDEDEDDVWPPVPVPSATMTYHYRFDDWSGPEDVPTLCRQYLDELRRVVADGQAKAFITS
jgi:hypothetical protein